MGTKRKGGSVIDDRRLIQKIVQGETHHYAALIEKYQKLVYYTIIKMLDGNKQDAEDLTQEVFIAAYRSIGHFRYDCSFSTWMVKIAINRTLDYKRRNHPKTTAHEQALERLPANDGDPEQTWMHKESANNLRKKIGMLPVIYQNVLKRYYFDRLSYKEIATREGLEVKTVESRLYRAKAMLKKLWKEKNEDGV